MSKFAKNLYPWIFSTAAVYVLVAGALINFIDLKDLKIKTTAATLSRLMPSYEHLINVQEGRVSPETASFLSYILYFEKLNKQIAPRPDTYSLLGFCHYHLGDVEEAVENYEKAAKLYGNFFWFYYNLGVIYFQKEDYAKSAVYFNKAIETTLSGTLTFMSHSRVYIPIMTQTENMQEYLGQRLRKGYRNAYLLQILSQEQMGGYEEIFRLANEAIGGSHDEKGEFSYFAGLASFHMKNPGQAIFYLQKSAKINPNLTQTFEYLGLSLRLAGQKATAEKILAEGLRLKNSVGMWDFNVDKIPLQIF